MPRWDALFQAWQGLTHLFSPPISTLDQKQCQALPEHNAVKLRALAPPATQPQSPTVEVDVPRRKRVGCEQMHPERGCRGPACKERLYARQLREELGVETPRTQACLQATRHDEGEGVRLP